MRFHPLMCSALSLAIAGCSARSSLEDADLGAGGGGASSTTTTSKTGTLTNGTGGAGTGGEAQTCLWAERFGDPFVQRPTSIAVDPQGAIYVAGVYQGSFEVGASTLDAQTTEAPLGPAFLVKLAPDGSVLWAKSLGEPGDVLSPSVAVGPGGVPVVSLVASSAVDFGVGPFVPTYPNTAFVATLHPSDGHLVWARDLGVGNPELQQFLTATVAVDAQGNIAVFGDPTGSLPTMYLAKLDADGTELWSHLWTVVGGLGTSTAEHPVFDAQGNISIAMTAIGLNGWPIHVDFGNGPVEAPFGSVMVARFDADGQHVYSRLLDLDGGAGSPPGQFYLWPVGLATDAAGDLFLGTTFWGSLDLGLGKLTGQGNGTVVVAKLDPSGKTTWNRTFGASAGLGGLALGPTAGRLLMSGYVGGSIDLGGAVVHNDHAGADVFVASLDAATGAPLSKQVMLGTAGDSQFLLAADGAGHAVIAGQLVESMTFCGQTLTSAGDADLVVASLVP